MRYKKILVLAILLVSLLAVSTVNAAERGACDIASIGNQDNDVLLEIDNSNIDDNVLNANPKTFADLNTTINGNDDGDIYLNGSYTYNPDTDSNFNEGITINRAVTIHGNGFAVDGLGVARIFYVNTNDVVLQDIVFVNGYSSMYGGAISGKGYSAVNCTFIGNSAKYGGAMYRGSALNSTFINNSAVSKGGGGAIFSGSAVNCTFTGNSAKYGGAMSGGSAVNCTFIGNSAEDNGGAMSGKGSSAANCTFTGNSAGDYGGAMAYVSSAVNCTFTGNSAVNYGGGMYDGSAVDCTFINNSAVNFGGDAIFSGYAVNCTFVNDDVSGVDTVNCTFIPAETFIVALDLTTFYGVCDDLMIMLLDINGNAVSGAQITVLFNNESYNECTDSDGVVSIAILDNLNPNTYTATISYAGDDIYLPSDKTVDVTVNKAKTDFTVMYDASELLAILTNDAAGYGIEGADVKITINNHTCTAKTDDMGIATFFLANLTPGTYEGTVSYEGSVGYEPSNITVNVTVDKSYVNLSAIYNNNAKELVVSLVDAGTGSALKGANVVVNVDGNRYNVRIASSGQGRLSLADLNQGTYTATAAYKGNGNYCPTDVDLEFTVVNKDEVNLSAVYNANAKELVVSLVDSITGSALKGANVVVNVGGNRYNVRISSTCQGRLSLADLDYGNYALSATYKGNVKYNPSTVDLDIAVKDAVNLSAVYDSSTKEVVVSLVDAVSGSALKGANVAVTIGGEKYTVKINSKGEGRISVADLDYGTYAVTLAYKGNAKYVPTTVDLDIAVKDAVNLSAVYDEGTEDLTVTLVDAVTGSALKGANVVVNIGGVKYNVKITSAGQGKLSLVNLASGTYTAAVSYKGNAKYNPSSTTASIVKN